MREFKEYGCFKYFNLCPDEGCKLLHDDILSSGLYLKILEGYFVV